MSNINEKKELIKFKIYLGFPFNKGISCKKCHTIFVRYDKKDFCPVCKTQNGGIDE